jgi:hypothetical protein
MAVELPFPVYPGKPTISESRHTSLVGQEETLWEMNKDVRRAQSRIQPMSKLGSLPIISAIRICPLDGGLR